MILELVVNVLFTEDSPEGIALICRQCRVCKRVMVNDGKGRSTIGANCSSHFSMLTWHPFPDSNCLVLAHLRPLFPSSARSLLSEPQDHSHPTVDLWRGSRGRARTSMYHVVLSG
jgi:hypothetical protein